MALPAGRYGVTKRQLNKVKNLPVNTIGMIDDGVESSYQLLEDTAGWISKNLNKYPYYHTLPRTDAGITFTAGSGQSIVANNQATGLSRYRVHNVNDTSSTQLTLDKGKYILTGCPEGGSDSTYNIYVGTLEGGQSKELGHDYGNGVEFEITADNSPISLVIQILSGTSVSNLVFTPMIRRANIIDATYELYHASIDTQKTDKSVIGPVEDGTICQNPDGYAIGQHFQRDGGFCTAIADIAYGATLTENTNYTRGQIGDIIYLKLEKASLSIEAGSSVTFDFDDLITISNYDVLNLSLMIRGTGAANGIAKWAYSTSKKAHILVQNPTEGAVTWTIYGYITIKIN